MRELDDARREQIVRLLQNRDEHLPLPARRGGGMAGFVHKVEHPLSCPDCLANGKAMFGCETCGGRGVVEEMVERDPYATDKVSPYGLDGTYLERVKYRDQQIEVMRQQLAAPRKTESDLLAEANASPYAWEKARKDWYRDYDFGALDRVLEELRAADGGAYSALHAVYVYGWAEPSTSIDSACERGLRFLDDHLPTPLRVPTADPAPTLAVGRVARAAGVDVMAERDAEIRRAVLEAHVPTADVARTWGITPRQVNRIVARSEAA